MRLRQSSAADSKLRPDGGEGRRKEGEKEVERKGGGGAAKRECSGGGGRTREIRSATPNFIHRSYSGLTGLILLLACSALSKRQKP